MKKITMLFLLFLISTGLVSAQSPTGKGVYSISGGVSYSHTSFEYELDSFSVFSLSPGLYYFVMHNFAIGATVTYYKYSNYNDYTTIGIGPGAKYYFDVGNIKLFIPLRPKLHLGRK